ncbi:MAG TPA: N-6 DNA methylase [Micromonosporaceae bacterium]
MNPDWERLLVWLEAILATQESVRPTPLEIQRRLGASSPAHLLDYASLNLLYESASSVPEVQLKRELWGKLLRTAFGKAFTDDQRLFVNHTLLVLTAEIIAHAVVGFDVSDAGNLTPAGLAQGIAFSGAQIYGAVEADFFDWVLHVDGGDEFIRELARRVARFDWSQVEHDVLKILYEEVIPQEDRATLGEYYTPDWLADRMVAATVDDSLNQRVLDPACGSGTFVFHAIRAYLTAADAAGIPNGKAVSDLTERVLGMDVHPVAVTLARVTYLLAIGRERLAAPDRGPISVPVYLGDSVQWEQRRDLLGREEDVRIATTGEELVDGGAGVLFGDDLIFPRSVLHDAGTFDRLVTSMADRAVIKSPKRSGDLIAPVLRQFGVHESDVQVLTETFDTMRRLHSTGRDHIWGYYVRNLIRPLWLADRDHRVDVLIGNPPWLRYSKMTGGMQERFKDLARNLGLLKGRLGASGRDLSNLFVARAVELYLKPLGKFSFVMPHGTLTRKPSDGFRSGRWGGEVYARFEESWDLSKAPTGFPMVSCVVHGTKMPDESARRMPAKVSLWSSTLRTPNVTWAEAEERLKITPATVSPLGADEVVPSSPYKKRFRQGAVLAPRMLVFVNELPAGPIGVGAGRVAVESYRPPLENKSWRKAPSIKGTVERAFVRPIHLGETLLPYKMLRPLRAVLPVSTKGLLTPEMIEDHPGLASWWASAEETWSVYKVPNDESSLLQRIDTFEQLTAQIPTSRHRVVYSKAGNTIAAARLDDPEVIIDHKLYWAAASSESEARYLTAVLNSTTVLERVRPLQAVGLFGGRDIDKNVFAVPIPTYDGGSPLHQSLVGLASDAERIVAGLDLSAVRDFKRARKVVRDHLSAVGISAQIDQAVEELVPAVDAMLQDLD